MRDLQQQVIEAHGGLDRFRQFSFLTARLHQFGILWDLKGKPDVLAHANVRVDLRKEEVSHWPFHPTQNLSRFTPDEVRIETPAGEVIESLPKPRASFAGFAMETHWSDPQLAYFSGYTMWTYLTSPFILAQPGVDALANSIESLLQLIDRQIADLDLTSGRGTDGACRIHHSFG
jgi:hypothetical protein